jgi:diaminopimelate decarboxylase
VLPDSATVNQQGHLEVGGCSLTQLATEFGTPLYVYDEATIRNRAREYTRGLQTSYPGASRVCYAAKAYCAPWLLQLLADEGLGLDVVSGGELYVARASGFPPERIYFHGNNKSEDELWLALDIGVHRVVVDNLEEVERLSRLATDLRKTQSVLLRVAPGVQAHTHEHIATGVVDTKFGVNIQTGAAEQVAGVIQAASGLKLVGLHAHIGSQVFEVEPYQQTIERVVQLAARLRDTFGFKLEEFSPGGGFGMRYTPDDPEPLAPPLATRALAEALCTSAHRHGFGAALPSLTIEPGRSIVGPSAVALYRVGSIKHIQGVRTYVAVDGGMADNIRPATYGARYTALLANRANEQPTDTLAIAGRYCESGDVLIRDVKLPVPRLDDLVAVPGAGAYQLAMASNYNLSQRPAVVVVKDGNARLVRRRETYDDLLNAEVL